MMITDSPDIARFAVEGGVDRIFVDLEMLGKQERQGHLNTVISRHELADVQRLRPVVPAGRLLVRINPIHAGSQQEIDQVVEAGADILMLPMFRTPAEVAAFTTAVGGRARCCLLVETLGASMHLQDCVRVPGVDEVHIGLNDLHLELGLDFMFEPLANGMVDELCDVLRAAGLPFGIGGVARVGEGLLPAEAILSEHARLGSTGAILSRTFHRQASSVAEIQAQMDFPAEVAKLRAAYAGHLQAGPEELQQGREAVQQGVRAVVAAVRARKAGA
ncbi:aldolase/citrate lyase family protein [Roseateles sp. DB2]|uniref:aldolase/citrate lyase family protein n=1 Tax=Roseateles sp. DB2 TaxID=3453717 RepID=UPI003F70048E